MILGRGALHLHSMIWTDLTATELNKLPIMTQSLQSIIDSIICADLPEKVYIDGDTRRLNKIPAARLGLQKCPFPMNLNEVITFTERHHLVAEAHRHLKHHPTCRKGTSINHYILILISYLIKLKR